MDSETASLLQSDLQHQVEESSQDFGQDAEHYGSISTPGQVDPVSVVVLPARTHELEEMASESFMSSHNKHHQGAEAAQVQRSDSKSDEEEKLFQYMQKHVHHVEAELRRIPLPGEEIGTYSGNEELYINRSDRYSLTTDLTIHEDHFGSDHENSFTNSFTNVEDERRSYKLASNRLHKLRQEVQTLIAHLESECTKLELLDLLALNETEFSSKRQWYKDRLESCLEKIKNRATILREKTDSIMDGIRTDRGFTKSVITVEVSKSPIEIMTWIHGLLFIFLLGLVCFMYLWSKASDEWTVYLRLIRSPLLIPLLLYLYGINMKVWAMFKIDYVAIFSHPPDATPTPKYIFKVASTLTVLMALLVVGVIVSSAFPAKIPVVIIPMLMWLLLFSFLLNPFDVFERKIRFHLVIAFFRVVLSPFVFVYFSDFFLADQFNSSAIIFLDMEYFLCYTIFHTTAVDPGPGTCTRVNNGIRPVITLLPPLWRLLQCLRAFYDTHKVKHLVNAGKYFSTLPVVVFATLFSIYEKEDLRENFDLDDIWILFCWMAVSCIHAAYTFAWDVVQDWGLWNLCCSQLHRELVYRKKAVYMVAIVVNFVLRCLWILKITLAVDWEKHSDLILTGLVVTEMFRRFLWNFIRVEHAHVLSTK